MFFFFILIMILSLSYYEKSQVKYMYTNKLLYTIRCE